jgi:hypothetical protein
VSLPWRVWIVRLLKGAGPARAVEAAREMLWQGTSGEDRLGPGSRHGKALERRGGAPTLHVRWG